MNYDRIKREMLNFVVDYLNNIYSLSHFIDYIEQMFEEIEQLAIYSSFELLSQREKSNINNEILFLIRERRISLENSEKKSNIIGGSIKKKKKKKGGSLNKKQKREHLSNNDSRTIKRRILDYFKHVVNICNTLSEIDDVNDNIEYYFEHCPDYQHYLHEFDEDQKLQIFESVSDLIERKRDTILFNQRERSNITRERPPRNILDEDDDWYRLGFR